MSFIYGILILGFCGAVTCNGYTPGKGLTIEAVSGPHNHPEGLIWSSENQKLLFVDIVVQRICRLDTATGEVTYASIKNGPVGFLAIVEDTVNRYAVGAGRDLCLVVWNDKSNNTKPHIEVLATVDDDHPGDRWNDGKADSHGRIWAGTIGAEVNEVVVPDESSLYRIGLDLKPIKEITPVTNSNGLAWNVEEDTFYYIDTPTREIAAYDYEPHSGTISNRRIAFDFKKNGIDGLPDGMTIDTDGNLYVAMYNGGTVRKVNPHTGELLKTIRMPAKKVTTVTFGGPYLDTLYVATSSRGMTEEELEKQPEAGYIFAIRNLHAYGLMANSFRMNYSTPRTS